MILAANSFEMSAVVFSIGRSIIAKVFINIEHVFGFSYVARVMPIDVCNRCTIANTYLLSVQLCVVRNWKAMLTYSIHTTHPKMWSFVFLIVHFSFMFFCLIFDCVSGICTFDAI